MSISASVLAQIIVAAATLVSTVVFGLLYYWLLRVYRKIFDEMREQRIAGARPQVIVEADYGDLPQVDLVIRNVSGGAATDISFGFSSKVESSDGFILTELPYFKYGVNFLAPNSEIRVYWDSLENLVPLLKNEGMLQGITVKVSYRDMSGETFRESWTFNPLLYAENRNVRHASLTDLVEAVEDVSHRLDKLASDIRENDGSRDR